MTSFEAVARLSAVAVLSLVVPTISHAQNGNWKVVEGLTHKTEFTAIDRDGNCTTGSIKEATDKALALKTTASVVSIPKDRLLRFEYGYWPHGHDWPSIFSTVYNDRSSWSDLQLLGSWAKANPYRAPPVRVRDKKGKVQNGKLEDVSDTAITLGLVNSHIVIAKSDVARVERIVEKPLSNTAEFCWEECVYFVIFDPELYPRIFHIGDTMPVLIYDAAMPQDDTQLTCK